MKTALLRASKLLTEPKASRETSEALRHKIRQNIFPHVEYYNGKGDPDDFIHAFEWATKMEKWVMPVSCHMFVYILKDAARVWWNSLPKGVVSNYKDLKKSFRKAMTDSWIKYTPRYKQKRQPSKGDPLHLWTIEGGKLQKGRPWEGSGRKNKERRDRYGPYKEPNLGILQNLSKTPREILASKKVIKTFIKLPKMVSKTKDTSKYYEFHQDYGHDTNTCRELKSKIEEAVKSGKLAYLIKEIRKGNAKKTDTQLGEWIALTVKA
ncbi:hypothetical protein Tco_1214695 [Tanacetum coccineum]